MLNEEQLYEARFEAAERLASVADDFKSALEESGDGNLDDPVLTVTLTRLGLTALVDQLVTTSKLLVSEPVEKCLETVQ